MNTLDKAIKMCDESQADLRSAFLKSVDYNLHYTKVPLKDEGKKKIAAEYLMGRISKSKLDEKAKEIVNKVIKACISDYKTYANQAKRGAGPAGYTNDVQHYLDLIKYAEKMKV